MAANALFFAVAAQRASHTARTGSLCCGSAFFTQSARYQRYRTKTRSLTGWTGRSQSLRQRFSRLPYHRVA